MTKLSALWKLLWSEHFLILAGDGSCHAVYPRKMNQLTMIKTIAEEYEKASKADPANSKGDGE